MCLQYDGYARSHARRLAAEARERPPTRGQFPVSWGIQQILSDACGQIDRASQTIRSSRAARLQRWIKRDHMPYPTKHLSPTKTRGNRPIAGSTKVPAARRRRNPALPRNHNKSHKADPVNRLANPIREITCFHNTTRRSAALA